MLKFIIITLTLGRILQSGVANKYNPYTFQNLDENTRNMVVTGLNMRITKSRYTALGFAIFFIFIAAILLPRFCNFCAKILLQTMAKK